MQTQFAGWMKTVMVIIGLLVMIGLAGMIDRGWFDWLGLGAMAMLVIPIVVALRSE